MSADLSLVLPQYQRAKNRWLEAATRLQEIAEFLLPYQSNITIFGAEGRAKTQRLYHSSGILAADKLARTMHGTVTPPAYEWHSPVMRQEALNESKPIRGWLQSDSKRMFAARRQSNFGLVAGRAYHSLVALGTAGVFIEERPATVPGQFGGLRYHFMPLGTFYIAQNGDDAVDTLYRDLRWPVRSVVERFGDDSQRFAALPESIKRQYADKPDTEVDFVHAVYPRLGRDPRKAHRQHWPWASCYFIPGQGGGSTDGAHILDEGGYQEQPFAVARWDVAQREVWGLGPGHLAYPDVRSLNKIRELKLMAGGTAVYPPTIRTQRVLLTEVSIPPNAVMTRSEEYPSLPALEAFKNEARFDVAKLLESDLEAAVAHMFYVDELMTPERPNMTAYEISQRVEERQRLLGPTMGRLEAEWLTPLFEREFGLMLRGGAFEAPPPELLEALGGADKADIDVQWEGPLARAQRSGELMALDRFNQHVFSVATVNPAVLDKVNFERQLEIVAEVTGINPDTLNDDQRVQQIREARAQQQQAQQQMAGITQLAEAAGKAAPALTAVHQASQPAATPA